MVMADEGKAHPRSKTLEASLQRSTERKSQFLTDTGLEVASVYTHEDMGHAHCLAAPGEYPFTRGIQHSMYRGRLWTMRQYSGFASPEESNHRFLYLLQQGQTGLSVAFDLPTQMGYDSDHSLSKGEVGKVGVPIDTLRDMEILLNDIPLDQVSTSMTINATAGILLAMYLAVGKKQGINQDQLKGTIQNDILKEYISRGTYIYPPKPSMRLVTDTFAYCAERVKQWNSISISGYHMREAGATAVQELAFTFSNAIAYIGAALDTGMKIDEFCPQLSFFFAAQNNLLEEVAKFRAARRIWAKITRDKFHAKNPRSWMLRFHVQTAGVTLTAQQPDNNVVRTTIQALAAVLGGAQSLHVNSKDEALSLPTEQAAQLSLRTQQIIAHESGVADTVDPLGGSYYLENLTNRLEKETDKYLYELERMGGAVAALGQGYQMLEIQESAFRYQQEVEANMRTVVGINEYMSDEAPIRRSSQVSPEQIQLQLKRLGDVRQERDNDLVGASLKHLEEIAQTERNTMPAILECVEAYASVGEISDALRRVFGEHQHTVDI